jgi:hypothetical protein
VGVIPDSTFLFNPKTASDNPYIGEWRKQLEDIDELIKDLCQRVLLAEQYPLFEQLIKFFPAGTTPKEIKTLGKALIKYADLLPEKQELQEKIGAIDFARKNPDVLALAFHDTSTLATDFENFLQEKPE